MTSVASMLRRMFRAMKYAAQDENFGVVAGAALTLIVVGTVVYSSAKAGAWSTGSTSPSAR